MSNEKAKELLSCKIIEVEKTMFSWANCDSGDKQKADQYALEACRQLSQLKETQKLLDICDDIPNHVIGKLIHDYKIENNIGVYSAKDNFS